MSVVVKNLLTTTFDVPGRGLIFGPGQEIEVDSISPDLAAAIQNGYVSVVSQEDSTLVTVEENGQTEFELPFPWPGPGECHLVVGGLIQTYGTDYEVDAETNTLTFLDDDIVLAEDDVLKFIRRAS